MITRSQFMDWGRKVFNTPGPHKIPQGISKQAIIDLHKILGRRMEAPAQAHVAFDSDNVHFDLACNACGQKLNRRSS